MTSKRIARAYKTARTEHFVNYRGVHRCHRSSAIRAIAVARSIVHAGIVESSGLVRLKVEPDDCFGLEDLLGDTYDHDANPDISSKTLDHERDEEIDRINRDGVWYVVGQYRLDPDSADWIDADSCGGFIGDDYKGSGYDTDLLISAISELTEALRSRCPKCRKAA